MVPSPLVQALLDPNRYPHSVVDVRLIETHISWVFLAGAFAYKIKKPIDLGFLDFSTLEKRKRACEEELRLNRRTAPDLYLAVLPVYSTSESPVWTEGSGDPIEYAVQMVRFDESLQMDRMLAQGMLTVRHMDVLAETVAEFHENHATRSQDSDFGHPDCIRKAWEDNFRQIRQWNSPEACRDRLDAVEGWTVETHEALRERFVERKKAGFIRECHGDLHLKNLAWMAERPLVFDCIEFDPFLRWIDVMNDCAFLAMDLEFQGSFPLSQRFLDGYVERTGDFEGLSLLRFYKVYRAMVRAKVRLIRARQEKGGQEGAMQEFCRYIGYAFASTEPVPTGIILTFGVSASGKSRIARSLTQILPVFRIRSDVERKRLVGIDRREDASAGFSEGIYSLDATRRTYDRLLMLCERVLDAGYGVVVDAAFLRFEERERFRRLAVEKGVPLAIVKPVASVDRLRYRIRTRSKGVSDAGPEILEHQLQTMERLTDVEREHAFSWDTEADADVRGLAERILAYFRFPATAGVALGRNEVCKSMDR